MFRGILFDFDGTLADTMPIALEAFRRAVRHHRGTILADDQIRKHFGPSEAGVMTILTPEAPQEGLDTYHQHYEDLHDALRSPFAGLSEILQELKQRNVKLGVVTGKGMESLEISLRFIGLVSAFDALEAGCEHGPCKPVGIQRILAEWRLAPGEVLYVGDSVHDVTAAREVGMPIASVSWAEPNTYDALKAANPDYLFATVQDFAAWILKTTPQHG